MESKYQIPEQALADFSRGTGCESYKFLGAHLITMSGQVGIRFAVWAPSVKSVQVISEVDGWQKGEHWLDCLGSSGVWAGFFPELGVGTLYKRRNTMLVPKLGKNIPGTPYGVPGMLIGNLDRI